MGILNYIDGYLKSGDAWEDLCVECYRQRYVDEHYTPIPATQGGDSGIEGFTQSGVVHQCYCPERDYTDNELYNHLRDKMSADIDKLMKAQYAQRLNDLGVPAIKEWHFVIPEYRDDRILKHAQTKRLEVLSAKKDRPNDYLHIHDDFVILIKCAAEFNVEIIRHIRSPHTDYLLNLTIKHSETPDWEKCGDESEKVANIRRKIKAVMNTENDSDDVDKLVSQFVESYISGLTILNDLQMSAPEFHKDLIELEQVVKRDVAMQTVMNTDPATYQTTFFNILNNFEDKLKAEFAEVLTLASIGELKQDLVSSWLADCSMEFRK